MAGVSQGVLDLDFWQDVYGFSMAPVLAHLAQQGVGKALVLPVAPCDVVTCAALLQTLDLATMAPADADFSATVELQPPAEVSALYHNLVNAPVY